MRFADFSQVSEVVEVKQEAEPGDTPAVKDDAVSFPTSIKYNDKDTLAHHSVCVFM